jgi:hypothetical protein
MQAWRKGNLVITSSVQEGQGLIKKFYDLNSQKFMVIDSVLYQKSGRVDSTVVWLDCYREPGCTATYRVEKKKGIKTILGYRCVNYIIEEEISNKDANRIILVWVTEEIKPAVSVYAVLRLYKKILPIFTPLEIKESPTKEALSYQLSTAINISK